ncbi:hypothetical protein CHMI_03793 [Cellulomonas hominis]|nr:hypothetical protein CHMI_03793 [Cellulomonas hominis]
MYRMPWPTCSGSVRVCMWPESCAGTQPSASRFGATRGLWNMTRSTPSGSSQATSDRRVPTSAYDSSWVWVVMRRVAFGSWSPSSRMPRTSITPPSSTVAPARAYWAVVSAESWLPGAVMRSTPSGIARANVVTQYCSTDVPFMVVSPASRTTCAPDSSVSDVIKGAMPTLQCRSETRSSVTGSSRSSVGLAVGDGLPDGRADPSAEAPAVAPSAGVPADGSCASSASEAAASTAGRRSSQPSHAATRASSACR